VPNKLCSARTKRDISADEKKKTGEFSARKKMNISLLSKVREGKDRAHGCPSFEGQFTVV